MYLLNKLKSIFKGHVFRNIILFHRTELVIFGKNDIIVE